MSHQHLPFIHEIPFSPHTRVFTTTRHGGQSKGDYATFNIYTGSGDNPNDALQNRILLCKAFKIKSENIFLPGQTHGCNPIIITRELLQKDHSDISFALQDKDIIMTDLTDCCIGVSTADCIPIILYSPISHSATAIHAGWRGTHNRIVPIAIQQMCDTWQITPRDIHAVIGPGIAIESFEVGQEVYDAFKDKGFDMSKIAIKKDKWHIDLPLSNKLLLLDAGIPEAQISDIGIDTYTHHRDFFSARRLGLRSGRIFTGIILSDKNQE